MSTTSPLLEMTPRQILDKLQDSLGIGEGELIQALGTNRRTLHRWRAGTAYPQVVARGRLESLVHLQQRVAETFTSPAAGRRWMAAPSRYLGGITPTEAIRAGRSDRVEAALEAVDSGVFL